MLRQLNVKRQLTIPAPLAKRLGFSSKSWVDVSERSGVLVVVPMNIEAQQAKPLELSDKDWQAFNRKVHEELRTGKGKVHADSQSFLNDLRRRIRTS
jgi:bifunctional DNA-binding transcriptional regulator/antitoxin component of YhaV-PrlF toxin-antitoxin module